MSRREYDHESAALAYTDNHCPRCHGILAGADNLENDDGINFWTVKNCLHCNAEITISLTLQPSGVVALTGKDIET